MPTYVSYVQTETGNVWRFEGRTCPTAQMTWQVPDRHLQVYGHYVSESLNGPFEQKVLTFRNGLEEEPF